MATYSTSQFKSGLKIILDGDPYTIVENTFVKPGKGQAFSRVKVRNLKNGRTVEKTFKSGDSVEAADVMETDLQYLYNDGEFYHFMDTSSFEQYQADETAVGDAAKSPLTVVAPNFVELKVTQTDPGLKGDTAQGGSKPATLETGAVVQVPLFVEEGEVIRVDTRSGEYSSRAKS